MTQRWNRKTKGSKDRQIESYRDKEVGKVDLESKNYKIMEEKDKNLVQKAEDYQPHLPMIRNGKGRLRNRQKRWNRKTKESEERQMRSSREKKKVKVDLALETITKL